MCADSKSLSDKLRLITKEDNESFLESLKINRGKGLIFLFVGQIIERKGVLELLKAWQKYIRIFDHDCLLLVGNGTLLPVYQKLYPDSENLKFIGDVDYSLIQNYYSIADVFIMPTLEDNWSLVVPEAMSCGLPIATSIYNGCYPELVTEKNGLVFDPLNEQSINGALEYFHRPDINLQSMGEASVQIEKEFSPERAASKIVNGLKRE